ncbi:polysaccharide biosynthesis tyrosine autokinase [Pseudomonas abieticivorans]|uniref:polysaccharide biosynthesis tyrosine autokinase n=1 Tax=Pseudomonas abieticivorans TaxID=2931382 RepID=UPI0020C00EA1|nr:polysaccharide biosynthesis tyrosine autokinase [Pseudomonas sp. PIA16]
MQPIMPKALHSESDTHEFVALAANLIDSKWKIAGLTSVFMAVAIAYSVFTPPIFSANALVQVEPKKADIFGLSDISSMLGGASPAATEIELIKSRSVVGKAVKNLRLNIIVQPRYLPGVGYFLAKRYESANTDLAPPRLGLERYNWGGERASVTTLEVPDALLEKDLTLRALDDQAYELLDDDQNLLLQGHVGVEADQQGVKILVRTLEANPGARFTVRKEYPMTTILRLQDDMDVTEKGKDSGIVALSLENRDPERAKQILNEIGSLYVKQNVERTSAEAAASLDFLKEQLPSVKQDLEKAESALNAYQTRKGTVDISVETKAVLDRIVALDTQISQLRLGQLEMDRQYTHEHPAYQALVKQISQLNGQKQALAKGVEALPETQKELMSLTRDVKVSSEIYTQLLNKSQELDVMRAGAVGNVRLIDSADADMTKPVKPKKLLIILIATFLGAFISVALVLIRKSLNRGVESVEDIEQFGLPVYASIPQSLLQDEQKPGRSKSLVAGVTSRLLAFSHPTDTAIEALRSLRTSMHFAMLESHNKCVMISGPSPSVGKTFVSINLATVIAQAGKRVLLVDGDMRKGYIHEVFGKEAQNGLSDILVKRSPLSQCIHETEVAGLFFVARGQVPPNPSELLMHANFEAFIRAVDDAFDFIIIDTPPVLAVTDALIIGRHCGTNLMVARFGLSPVKEISYALRKLQQNGVGVGGLIFNGLRRTATNSYGYGGYGYVYDYKSHSH